MFATISPVPVTSCPINQPIPDCVLCRFGKEALCDYPYTTFPAALEQGGVSLAPGGENSEPPLPAYYVNQVGNAPKCQKTGYG